jgi:hypothetical protein
MRRVLVAVALVGAVGAVAYRRRQAGQVGTTATRALSGAPFRLQAKPRSRQGLTPRTQVLGPSWEPPPLSALARWDPAPLRSPPARLLGYVWAAPLTAVGLVAGLTTGARPQQRDGTVLFAGARGPIGVLLRRQRYAAAAMGHVVVAAGEPSRAVMEHELVHVRQAERLGPLLPALYGVLLAVYGYARHPLERAARGT